MKFCTAILLGLVTITNVAIGAGDRSATPRLKKPGANALLAEPTEKELNDLGLADSLPNAKQQLQATLESLATIQKAIDRDPTNAKLRQLGLRTALQYTHMAPVVDLGMTAVVLHRLKGLDQARYGASVKKVAVMFQAAKDAYKPGQGSTYDAVIAARQRTEQVARLKDLADLLDDPALKTRLTALGADAGKEGTQARAKALAKIEAALAALTKEDKASSDSAKAALADARKHYDAAVGAVLAKRIAVLKGHSQGVRSAVFSPDGKRIASLSYEDGLKVWDVENAKAIVTIREVRTFAGYLPDGKRLVGTTSDENSKNVKVKVWDATTGKEELQLKTTPEWCLAVSPDGKRVISTLKGKRTVRDVDSGETLVHIDDLGEGYGTAAFSADGKRIVCSSNYQVRVVDVASGKNLLVLPMGDYEWCKHAALSADGTRLAVGGHGNYNRVAVWDVANQAPVLTLSGHTASLGGIAFSPDGKSLVTASADKTVKVWDATSGAELLTLTGHTESIVSVCLSPSGKRLATASLDKTIRVWELDLE